MSARLFSWLLCLHCALGWQVFVLQAIVGCCAAQVLVGEKQLSKKSRLLLLPVIALIVFDPPLLD
jgi:hypothetical protein